jgi:ribosome-associated protein
MESPEKQMKLPKPKEWEVERMRPSGPGGEHMQKTESKVRVRWNFEASSQLSEEEKAKLREAFPEGYIEAVSQRTRSQRKNLEFARSIIQERAQEILLPKKERIPTQKPASAEEERLREKHRIAEKKALRRKVELE